MVNNFLVGEHIKLRHDSDHYTGNYAGTLVEIIKLDNETYCTVKAHDDKEFMCPYGFFEFEPPSLPDCSPSIFIIYFFYCY